MRRRCTRAWFGCATALYCTAMMLAMTSTRAFIQPALLRQGRAPLSYMRRLSTTVATGPEEARPANITPTMERSSTVTPPMEASTGTPDLPGDLDEKNFKLGPSVRFWRTWENNGGAANKIGRITQKAANTVLGRGSVASEDLLTAQYWAAHLLRSGFFGAQGLLGTVLTAARSGFDQTSAGSQMLKTVRERGDRILSEAIEVYEQDLRNIQDGLYKAPYDMNVTHRQYNPLFVLGKSARFLSEAVKTLDRRTKQQADPVWLKSDLYPPYYLNTWHFQTDGWLSTDSAKVYETSTETLFIGRQDAMQRHSLLPITSWLESRGLPSSGEGVSLLEVACGTGRFMTFVRDNYPGMNLTASELSPFYLQEARENMRYYESFKRRTSGGGAMNGTMSFVQASAEAVPMPNQSVDVLLCVYLFHELPSEVRAQVVKEMGRLVKPGGLVVITDSIQLGDRATLNPVLGNFQNFNEPNYQDYIETDLSALFREHTSLVPHEKHLISSTKVLSFIKPQEESFIKPQEKSFIKPQEEQA